MNVSSRGTRAAWPSAKATLIARPWRAIRKRKWSLPLATVAACTPLKSVGISGGWPGVPLGNETPSTHTLSKNTGTSPAGRTPEKFAPKEDALLLVGDGGEFRLLPAVRLRLNS